VFENTRRSIEFFSTVGKFFWDISQANYIIFSGCLIFAVDGAVDD